MTSDEQASRQRPILRFCGCAATVLMTAFLGARAVQGQQHSASFINIQPSEAVALTNALKARGWDAATQDAAGTSFTGAVVVLEARGELSPATLLALGTFVQHGGALLIGLDRHPGIAPAQLSFLSPTTAWITQAEAGSRPLLFSEIVTGASDPEIFGSAPQPSFTIPYFFPIRPVSAVERGVARYDRYEQKTANYLFNHPAGQFYWTRPLLNRDWCIRLQGNDRAASPLLLTGRYGAGRVAVFATSLTGEGAEREAFWKPVLQWLATPPDASASDPGPDAVAISGKAISTPDGAGALHVSLWNRTSQKLSLQVIGRILTWEEAFVGDSIQPIELAANASATVDLPMPKPGPMEYQALAWRRVFVVRVGVLSKSGAALLAEARIPIDLTPATNVELSTDNLYRVDYPYPTAPGIGVFPTIQYRMGMPVGQYAYPPSGTVRAVAVFTNGVHNIAALATVSDLTNPGNPSLVAIDDEGARGYKPPRGNLEGYGSWNGKAGSENVLRFHFPSPVTVTEVTLMGAAVDRQAQLAHNPGAISIECDGRTVLTKNDLDSRFVSENGLIHLPFNPVQTSDLLVRLPWVETLSANVRRTAPFLGEIEIEGTQDSLPAEVHGDASLVLRNAMTGVENVVTSKSISIPPGGRVVWAQGFKLPQADAAFYQLQVRFAGQTRTVPILAIQPAITLGSIELEHPPASPIANFVTTKGFRGAFPIGTGTRDASSSWETPDDLVWAYSHQVKQVDSGRRSWANWLYVTDSDMRHYSTPWTLFDSGESLLQLAAPNIVTEMKRKGNWATSKKVMLGFGDRWDSGPSLPSMFGWQELVAFDEYLRSTGKSGLSGATHDALNLDIDRHHASEWALWHEHRYVDTVELLRTTFAAAGKELGMSGQGIPMTSNTDAAILARTVRGMSSDNTWGMENESVPFTTGRQLADQAFNPEWKLGFNMIWGYDSSTLNNTFWYSPVGTTEASRRHWYDSAWRGIVNDQGAYTSSFAYGYSNNGGEAWTMAQNDYQQAWDAAERFSLLYPERPLGAGLIVSSNPVDAPTSTLFSGGGMGPDGASEALVRRVATTFQRLHEAGLSIPFTGNIDGVRKWNGNSPLILNDLGTASPEELEALKSLSADGTRIAAFAGHGQLTTAAAALFGMGLDGTPVQATRFDSVGTHTLLTHGNLLYIPFPADALTPEMSLQLAPMLHRWLDLPVSLPAGTMGYAFISGGRTMVVLEDWQEKARELSVRIRATGSSARALSLNDHNTLTVRRKGPDWIVTLPIRPGDGDVVILEQTAEQAGGQANRIGGSK